MSAYYYLMAQLPALQLSQDQAVSFETFKETASRFLTKKDAKILESLSLEAPREEKKSGSFFVDQWYKSERILRLVLEKNRADKLSRNNTINDQEKEIIHFVPAADAIAKQALNIESPLEAEFFLDGYRWSLIENLRGQNFYNSTAVFAYGLMLLLIERRRQFTVEAGSASYTSLYKQILENKA